jgi:hypothetical protein
MGNLTGRGNVACGELREYEHVLPGQELLPCLDLLLPGRRERLHDSVDERATLRTDMRLSLHDSFCRGEDSIGSI